MNLSSGSTSYDQYYHIHLRDTGIINDNTFFVDSLTSQLCSCCDIRFCFFEELDTIIGSMILLLFHNHILVKQHLTLILVLTYVQGVQIAALPQIQSSLDLPLSPGLGALPTAAFEGFGVTQYPPTTNIPVLEETSGVSMFPT